MARPPAILPPDTVINGRYRIEKFIGAGGFASVYKSHDLMIERDVAIKVLNIHALGTADEEHAVNLRRFRQEAKAAARIKHPTVVTIYDIGATSDFEQPFIVMEFLAGASLKQELARNGAMEPARAQRLLIPCLEALGEGHELGIIHKDLKPGNLFLTDGGCDDERLRLLDYGVARLQDESRAMTMGNQVVGTVAYLAPEYLVQQRVSPQLDVYQAGLILAEMLMGERVVVEDDVLAAANRHRFAQMEISEPLLRGPLGPVLATAMARDPDARYDNCDAFAEALKELSLEGIPALGAGVPRALLTSVNPPPEETADMDAEGVRLRVEGELGPTAPLDEPPAPTQALDSRELFGSDGEVRQPDAVIPGPDGAGPWEGETLAMEMPAHVVAAYDARVEAQRAEREAPVDPAPVADEEESKSGAFGLVLAAGAAVLALVVLIAVILAVVVVIGTQDDAPTREPVAEIDVGGLAEPPEAPDLGTGTVPEVVIPEKTDAGLAQADASPATDTDAGEAVGETDARTAAVPGEDAGSEAAAVDVTLASSPSRAVVYDAKRVKLGNTPLVLRIPAEGVELTFKARGYHTRKVRVRPKDAPKLVVTLKKRASSNTGIGIAQ